MVEMPIIAVLCHILKGEKLLLQKKPRGLFGAGKWNGVGGKLEQNEAPEEGGTLIFYFGDRKEAAWLGLSMLFPRRLFKAI